MAIAGVYVSHAPQSQADLLKLLGSMPQIVEINPVDSDKMAAIVEISGAELTGFLKKFSELTQILDLEIAYVNYEDDLNENGFMETPPEAKKYE